MNMIAVYLIVAGAGLLLGGWGGWSLEKHSSRAEVAQAESAAAQAESRAKEAEAAAAAVTAAGSLVKQAVAEDLAKTGMMTEVLSANRAKWLCEGEGKSETACTAYLLCSQVAAGTVQASACDAAVNEWISERQLAIIEGGGADQKLKDAREHILEKRK